MLDLTTGTWSPVDTATRDGGSSVMYLPGKILKTGMARNPDYSPINSNADAWAIDMNQSSPVWRQVASMAFPRTQHQLTVLPDGTVLVTGGSRNSDVFDPASAVKAAELWDPTTETWTTLSSGVVPRLYHSIALLLPDGRIAIGGGGHPDTFGVPEYRFEIFSPPYLFKGPRPSVSSAPTQSTYGQTFFVATPDSDSITKVALIPQPAVTHAFNLNPGYVPLSFTKVAGGLNVQAPANANLAPPGQYMLFLVNAAGVPSVATWLRFAAPWEASALVGLSDTGFGAFAPLSTGPSIEGGGATLAAVGRQDGVTGSGPDDNTRVVGVTNYCRLDRNRQVKVARRRRRTPARAPPAG